MATQASSPTDQATVKSLNVIERLFGNYASHNFAVRLWNGTTWVRRINSPPRFTLVLKHPSALRQMFLWPNEIRLAEAYIYGDMDIEGDVEKAIPLGHYLFNLALSTTDILRLGWQLLSIPADRCPKPVKKAAKLKGTPHSLNRDRQAIAYHYNVSNTFYELWLGRKMVYSCAYFVTPEEDLDTAQTRKLDYLCRKLRLRSGEALLDIGCGWGALIAHAAEHYGIHALGITLSEPQAELARCRIRKAGLESSCSVEVADYRELPLTRRFDKIVSVGMFEHVGKGLMSTYFAKAFDLLKPGGVFLNHAIAQRSNESTAIGKFCQRYVFPDGELLPIGTALDAAELSGFHTRDVESLREHYALTFRHWRHRLEGHAHEAEAATDAITYRIWRLSLASLAYWFEEGRFDVYQTLLSKPERGASRLPLTREDWYA